MPWSGGGGGGGALRWTVFLQADQTLLLSNELLAAKDEPGLVVFPTGVLTKAHPTGPLQLSPLITSVMHAC
jgi:hypothetical protein